MSLLGVEVDSRRCLVAAYAADGTRLAQAARGYRPEVRASAAIEIDVPEVWQAVSEAARQVTAQCEADPVTAVAVCGTGDGIVALDAQGTPLGPCLLGVADDTALGHEAEQRLGVQRYFEITGRLAGRGNALGLLCWLRRERPQILQRAWRVAPLGVVIGALLGGSAVCDYTQAGRAFPLAVMQRTWSRELAEACGLPRRMLPELMPAGTPIGAPTARAMQDWGLPRGARLVLGGDEGACRALGAGVVQAGQALYELGATLRLSPAFQAIPLTALMLSQGLGIAHHVVPGLFLSEWEGAYGERTLRWYRDNLAPLEKREAQRGGVGVYDLLISEMPDEPTDLLALPEVSLGNPVADGEPQAALLGVTHATSRGEIIRAILEGLTYRVAEALARCERAGLGVEVLRAVGGGAASERWLALTADVLGLPIERPQVADTGPLGAALLAGVGTGLYPSAEAAVEAAVHVSLHLEPDAERHAAYVERAELAEALRAALQDAAGTAAAEQTLRSVMQSR